MASSSSPTTATSPTRAPTKVSVVLIGFGEIARKQHLPILRSRPHKFRVSAVVLPKHAAEIDLVNKEAAELEVFHSLEDAIENGRSGSSSRLDVAVIACPPEFSQRYAHAALESGLSILLEKPPGMDDARLFYLQRLAQNNNVTMYTGYHSVFAPAMIHAKQWLSEKNYPLRKIQVEWKEDGAKWHKGQQWITTRQGFGVLDILCNPLSMIDGLLGPSAADAIKVEHSTLVVPKNWSSPVSGTTVLRAGYCCCQQIVMDYAMNYEDGDIWKMTIQSTNGNAMELHDGGAQMYVDGVPKAKEPTHDDILRPEYEALYNRFEQLLETKQSEVRTMPLRIVLEILDRSTVEVGEPCHI